LFGKINDTDYGKMVKVMAQHSSVPSGQRALVTKYSLAFQLKVPAVWMLPSMLPSVFSFCENFNVKYPHAKCPLTFDESWIRSKGTDGCMMMRLKLTAPILARLSELLNHTDVLGAIRNGYEPLLSFQHLVMDTFVGDPVTFGTQNHLPVQGSTTIVIWGILRTKTNVTSSTSSNTSSSSSSAPVTDSGPTIVAFQPPLPMRFCDVRAASKKAGDAKGGAAGIGSGYGSSGGTGGPNPQHRSSSSSGSTSGPNPQHRSSSGGGTGGQNPQQRSSSSSGGTGEALFDEDTKDSRRL